MLLFYLSMIEAEGDKTIFTELYKHYEHAMYNIAYSILHDRFLAEDAVHEAFIKLIKYIPELTEVKCHKTKALIVIIVKSTAIDIYRKRKMQYQFEVEELEEEADQEELPLDHIIADESFQELIRKLKKEYKEIILLKYVYDMSNGEISRLLSISESVVRQHLCRAKKAVKKLIEENKN